MSDIKEPTRATRQSMQFEDWLEIGCKKTLVLGNVKTGPLSVISLLLGGGTAPERIRRLAMEG